MTNKPKSGYLSIGELFAEVHHTVLELGFADVAVSISVKNPKKSGDFVSFLQWKYKQVQS